MTTSIGARCKPCEGFSRGVLIGRAAWLPPRPPRTRSDPRRNMRISASRKIFLEHKRSCLQDNFRRRWRRGHTRSHPEHGSQARPRRWYWSSGSGRVGSLRNPLQGSPPLARRGAFLFYSAKSGSALKKALRRRRLAPRWRLATDFRGNTPGGIRTHDLPLRRRTLYPAELRVRGANYRIFPQAAARA